MIWIQHILQRLMCSKKWLNHEGSVPIKGPFDDIIIWCNWDMVKSTMWSPFGASSSLVTWLQKINSVPWLFSVFLLPGCQKVSSCAPPFSKRMVLCFTTGPSQWSQMAMGWNRCHSEQNEPSSITSSPGVCHSNQKKDIPHFTYLPQLNNATNVPKPLWCGNTGRD